MVGWRLWFILQALYGREGMVCVCGMGGDVNGEASGKGRGKNHDTQDGVLERRNPRGCGWG